MPLRKINTIRYLQPFKEGGSLPALVEGDDGFLYVLKFRGAGQGVNALIAEILGAELARAIGLKVPELVFADLQEGFGRTEPDEEIQDLLKASLGLNVAYHFLSKSFTYSLDSVKIDELLASKILFLDALIYNLDRTAKNPNLLLWNRELWLIDHGASLYFHHNEQSDWEEKVVGKFPLIKDHILLPIAKKIEQAESEIKSILTESKLKEIINHIPDEWLDKGKSKEDYFQFLSKRLENSSIFVEHIINLQNGNI